MLMRILLLNLKLFLIDNFFRILQIFWFFFIIFQIYKAPENNKNFDLNAIKNDEFGGLVVKKEVTKRGARIISLETRTGLINQSIYSDELLNNLEIRDSLFKRKETNCCLVIGKNKRLILSYVISNALSDEDYVDCKPYKPYLYGENNPNNVIPQTSLPEVEIKAKK
jgi:hypothetical protein